MVFYLILHTSLFPMIYKVHNILLAVKICLHLKQALFKLAHVNYT